jgi:hypothetical protein
MRWPTRCTIALTVASLLMGTCFLVSSKLVSPNCISCPGDIRFNCDLPVTGTVLQPVNSNASEVATTETIKSLYEMVRMNCFMHTGNQNLAGIQS